MHSSTDYIEQNKATWNSKTDYHVDSEFYANQSFIEGRNTLKNIELELLGNFDGKSILHLQCHFGQDSLSLARMGAKVTGVDFSDKAIQKARELNAQLNLDASFICSDIYDAPNYLNEKFDMVFTSYGTIGWMPDLDKWAAVVASYMKPEGKFIMADFHPVVWMMDSDFSKIEFNYFNTEDIHETESGTYADRNAPIQNSTISWNHSTSELLSALFKNNMQLIQFNEYDYSPYNCFNKSIESEPGKFRIAHLGNKIPMVYSLVAELK